MPTNRLVHIVDDESIVRESTALLLQSSGYSVETWSSGVAFAEAAKTLAPSCVLLDFRMPQMNGLEVQRALTEAGVLHPIIMLTAHGDIAVAVACMKAGAVDFLEKPFRRPVLLEAIEKAFDRKPGVAGSPEAMALLATLTAREREVLDGLAAGFSNKLIARTLDISPRTVEIHRAHLMVKLEVTTLSAALRIAFAAEPRPTRDPLPTYVPNTYDTLNNPDDEAHLPE